MQPGAGADWKKILASWKPWRAYEIHRTANLSHLEKIWWAGRYLIFLIVWTPLRPEGESFKTKRWRDVNVTSTLVNVCKTLTNVDASRRLPYLSKSARRWRLKAYLSKAETLTWRQRFQKHTLGILLVDVCVWCKHKQRKDLYNYY